MTSSEYPRDMVGYGATPPAAKWPKGAKIAVQFVVNYEEGGERCILHGDQTSEAFLSEIVGAEPWEGRRHLNMESIYEFGSRVGAWRLLRIFDARGLPFTVFTVGMALERNPEPVRAMLASGHEIASHGYRWIDYSTVSEQLEREHIAKAVEAHQRLLGERPLGFYQGRTGDNSRRLCIEEGGFLYDADSYSDELPYWDHSTERPHLVVPYTLDANDMRFATPQGFNSGDQFFTYLKDSFDVLYAEGAESPRMMSVGLHCRLSGRPGRAAALAKFLDYIADHPDVWVARRVDIARHWMKNHPAL